MDTHAHLMVGTPVRDAGEDWRGRVVERLTTRGRRQITVEGVDGTARSYVNDEIGRLQVIPEALRTSSASEMVETILNMVIRLVENATPEEMADVIAGRRRLALVDTQTGEVIAEENPGGRA